MTKRYTYCDYCNEKILLEHGVWQRMAVAWLPGRAMCSKTGQEHVPR